MAGDWIKMRASLCTNPKVAAIADLLAQSPEVGRMLAIENGKTLGEIVTRYVTRDIAIASLLRVWAATNEHTLDGVWRNSTLFVIDQAAGLPGFGAAMMACEWLVYDPAERTVSLPDFLEWNQPCKGQSRNGNAQRQRDYRERKRLEKAGQNAPQNPASGATAAVTLPVTRNVTSITRDRDRERDLKTSPHTPLAGGDPDLSGNPPRKERAAIALKTYLLEQQEAGKKAIPAEDPVFAYASEAGIDGKTMRLMWLEFRARYTELNAKRYKDWPAAFRKAVRGNWFKLWYFADDRSCQLTTAGKQAEAVHAAALEAAAQAAA